MRRIFLLAGLIALLGCESDSMLVSPEPLQVRLEITTTDQTPLRKLVAGEPFVVTTTLTNVSNLGFDAMLFTRLGCYDHAVTIARDRGDAAECAGAYAGCPNVVLVLPLHLGPGGSRTFSSARTAPEPGTYYVRSCIPTEPMILSPLTRLEVVESLGPEGARPK